MKVLLSAYSCEPNRGSEPGVGWRWALEISRLGHEVWLLTRASRRPAIEAEVDRTGAVPNLHFLYYDLDLPTCDQWCKRGAVGRYLYYLFWQWGAYRLARTVHANVKFDRVQHITFGTVRVPSFMGNLGIPFIFGPAGGGERAPWKLRAGYGARGWLSDGARDLSNLSVRLNPLTRQMFKRAETIYVTSNQSRDLLPPRYRSKAAIQLAIGSDAIDPPLPSSNRVGKGSDSNQKRFLFVGRLICWKGMHLGLPAFAKVVQNTPSSRLTILGQGPEERRWRQLASRLGIAQNIDWFHWMEWEQLIESYRSHDALLFPSLHDSGGQVVLEAMSYGLPVVCLDLGGPGQIVDDTCGRVISTVGASRRQVIAGLSNAMIELTDDHAQLKRISRGAMDASRKFLWKDLVGKVYSPSSP